MKKFAILLAGVMAVCGFTGCNSDDDDDTNVWEVYRNWRDTNNRWVEEQSQLMEADGVTPYYQRIVPSWKPNRYVLMHWFNDRAETQGNLVPMETSTVSTKYQLFDIDGNKLDSSEGNDGGLFNTRVSGVIDGWQIALMNMHVGDTVQIVVPYQSGYGSTSTGEIQPYSALRFNVRLVDIPAYEVRP